MRYYPAFLDLVGKKAVVIGGGAVGERKAASLLAAGAHVTVVAPEISAQLETWVRDGKIEHRLRSYDPTDTEGAWIVMVATDDVQANESIAIRMKDRGCLVNVADRPDHSNFVVPSMVVRGDLLLAVSTGGALPALARKLRLDLEKQFGEEYVRYLALLKDVRRKLKTKEGAEERTRILYRLIESDLLDLVREGKDREIRVRVQEMTGLEDFDLSFP